MIELATALAQIGRTVRDAILAAPYVDGDDAVARHEGGDDIFGVDTRADEVVLRELGKLGDRWPGELVMEGFDQRVPIGGGPGGGGTGPGPWTYLVDPIDGTRPWLARKRSAWILLGAGSEASTLEELSVSAAVELPVPRARQAVVAWAADGAAHAVEDDLCSGESTPIRLQPRQSDELAHTYVTVARTLPGSKERLGRIEDTLLAGLNVYEDQYLSTGGQMMGLALGTDAAVIDVRRQVGIKAPRPYDMAALVIARAAGVIVETADGHPLDVPLDTETDLEWAGYANVGIAEQLRPRLRRLLDQ